MAESIGGKIRNVLVMVLIGLLVLAFAVWGVNDVFTPGANNAVLAVGDTEVTTEEFDEAFTRELRRISAETGEGLTNEQAYNQGLHRRVLQNMVTAAVISEDADDLGIGVNRRDARRYVEDIDVFKNELTGEFSEDKLNNILAQNRISRAQYEKDTLRDLRREQTVPAIIGGIEAPAEYATRFYDFISEQRRATILTINEDAIDPIDAPSDEVLKAYIDRNGASYMAPEYRQVIMIRLEPFDFSNDLSVTEQELKDAFAYRIELGEIGAPEMRDITIINTTGEDVAKLVAGRQEKGEDPALIASALGLSAPDVFTDMEKGGLIEPESDKAAFELAEGKAKAVLGSLGTWTAVYVPKITPAVVPDFEGAREDLEDTLLKDKAQDKLYDITGAIEDAMTEGQTLVEISDALNIPLSEYDFFDRSGTTQDGIKLNGFARIPGIAQDETLLTEIFTSDLGFETDLFETGLGGYAAIRVEDIIDSKMRPFEDVKDRAAAAWRAEQVTEALTAKAIALQAEIRGGKSLKAVAADLGDGAEVTELGLTRTAPPRNLGPQVAAGLLDGKIGDLVRGPGVVPLTHMIGRLDKIQPNQDALAGQFLDVVQERVTAELSADIQNAYQQAILSENELREYPDKVRSALGLDQDDE